MKKQKIILMKILEIILILSISLVTITGCEKKGEENKKDESSSTNNEANVDANALNLEIEYASDFKDGIAIIKSGGKYGAINTEGKTVLDCSNLMIERIGDLLKVEKDQKNGLVDKDGKVVADYIYQTIDKMDDDLYKVRKGDYGLINKDGKEIVPCNFLYIGEVSEGIITMKASDKFIYVTKEGKLITKKGYKNASDFSDGMAGVETFENNNIFIDTTGKEMVPEVEISIANKFSEGLAAVKKEKDGKYCYIDKTGKVVLDCSEYEDVNNFENGLARVSIGKKENERYGFIDKTGKVVIDLIYENCEEFFNGLAKVKKDGKSGYINTNGEFYEYDQMEEKNGKFIVKKDGKYGLLDKDKNVILNTEYQSIYITDVGLISVKKDGEYELLNENGKTTTGKKYLNVNLFSERIMFGTEKRWTYDIYR